MLMDRRKAKARELLRRFKGDDYIFGLGCIGQLGALTAALGRRAMIVAGGVATGWTAGILTGVRASLTAVGVEVPGDCVRGAGPNSPYEDVRRVARVMRQRRCDVIVAVGGGSVLDAAKASGVLAQVGGLDMDVEPFFGVGKVSAALKAAGQSLTPLVAVQLAAGSGAHLTKYSNITDMSTFQKKLLIDPAITPSRALFDYSLTTTMPPEFTCDGALDGMTHCMEVFFGARDEVLRRVEPVCTLGIDLIVSAVRAARDDGGNLAARQALGLGTDLGGYAIMIGGTSGAHLNSFSLVDLLPHGRACALMEPYYTVFFAPAIQPQLRALADIFASAGYMKVVAASLAGRDLAVAVAEAMTALSRDIAMPTTLGEIDGFTDGHIARMLAAARDPQLASKLANMPVPLSAEMIDDYMGPVLQAAATGDFSLIRNV